MSLSILPISPSLQEEVPNHITSISDDFKFTRCKWSVSGNRHVRVVEFGSLSYTEDDDILLLNALHVIIDGPQNAPVPVISLAQTPFVK